jgi:hypothetical protein
MATKKPTGKKSVPRQGSLQAPKRGRVTGGVIGPKPQPIKPGSGSPGGGSRDRRITSGDSNGKSKGSGSK